MNTLKNECGDCGRTDRELVRPTEDSELRCRECWEGALEHGHVNVDHDVVEDEWLTEWCPVCRRVKYTAWVNGVSIDTARSIPQLRATAEDVFVNHCDVKEAIFQITTGGKRHGFLRDGGFTVVIAEPWVRGGPLPLNQKVR